MGIPTAPGAVINIDGDRLMKTKFDNWVSEGVFVLSNTQVENERHLVANFVVEYDPDNPDGGPQ